MSSFETFSIFSFSATEQSIKACSSKSFTKGFETEMVSKSSLVILEPFKFVTDSTFLTDSSSGFSTLGCSICDSFPDEIVISTEQPLSSVSCVSTLSHFGIEIPLVSISLELEETSFSFFSSGGMGISRNLQ
ncbi:UNVERIFIED_CONTAM: hypothetical protein RMT77_014401 [Armadillidium vulgare]